MTWSMLAKSNLDALKFCTTLKTESSDNNTDPMSIVLNPELEQRIHAKVADGVYTDANAVVQDALALLEADAERLNAKKLNNLQEKLTAGLQDFETGRFVSIKNQQDMNDWIKQIK